MRDWEIVPLVGLGSLTFGLQKAELEQIVGPAEGRQEYEDGVVHLRYWASGVTLFLAPSDEAEDKLVLDGIEVDSKCSCHLLGVRPFDLDQESIATWLQSEWKIAPQLKTDFGEWRRLEFGPKMMMFYFDLGGNLTEINWWV